MDDYLKRPMATAEEKYAFTQSRQICWQSGLIGYLRADFGTNGKEFNSSWEDWNKELKTEDFELEFDDVINCLREKDDFLSSRAAMSKFCRHTSQSQMTKESYYYGVRVDTEHYAYLLRMTPNKGDFNLYCYCYKRHWLDRHMKQAERGIRFIDPKYNELFRIPDGDTVRITTSTGECFNCTCRYIDDCHVEVGQNLYHICEFAELMARNGNTVIPLRSTLPAQCYVYLPTTKEIGIVKKGESGYYRTDIDCTAVNGKEIAVEANEKAGVTRAQAEAMLAGSMFGWGSPAADPKNYDEDGKPVPPKHRDRGEAR